MKLISYETSKIRRTVKYKMTRTKATFNTTQQQITLLTRNILNAKN